MKKITRILSAALVAVMLLSATAISFAADDTTAYIPAKLSKLGLDVDLSDIQYPELSIKITNLAKLKINGEYVLTDPDYCPDPMTGKGVPNKFITEDSVAQFQFSEKPDWFGAVLSSLDGGWRNIEIDDDAYGELEIGELHRQPGMWSWYANANSHGAGGDYPYSGGKDYGDYSVNVSYHRDGSAYKISVTFKNAADPFLTGMEGGTLTVVYESVELNTKCYREAVADWIAAGKKNASGCYVPKPTPTSEWYLSHVGMTYPEGNYIVAIGTDWRNDAKQNLASYRVAYQVSENAIYRITYAPRTTSIYEEHVKGGAVYQGTKGYNYTINGKYTDLSKQDSSGAFEPSASTVNGNFVRHYTADEPIYGEFYKSYQDLNDGNVYAVSGSGNHLNWWVEFFGTGTINSSKGNVSFPANKVGKRIKSIKKGTTSFKSPRRLTK